MDATKQHSVHKPEKYYMLCMNVEKIELGTPLRMQLPAKMKWRQSRWENALRHLKCSNSTIKFESYSTNGINEHANNAFYFSILLCHFRRNPKLPHSVFSRVEWSKWYVLLGLSHILMDSSARHWNESSIALSKRLSPGKLKPKLTRNMFSFRSTLPWHIQYQPN